VVNPHIRVKPEVLPCMLACMEQHRDVGKRGWRDDPERARVNEDAVCPKVFYRRVPDFSLTYASHLSNGSGRPKTSTPMRS
jgi:hypothetical protein